MINRKFHDGGAVVTFQDHAASSCAPDLGEVVITNAPGRIGHNYAHWRVVSVEHDGEYNNYRALRCEPDGTIMRHPPRTENGGTR